MALRGEGFTEEDAAGQAGSTATTARVVYVLHPNCAVEEY
jgi:DNA replication licensing factor MCM6